METTLRYAGLDVHKVEMVIAVAEDDRDERPGAAGAGGGGVSTKRFFQFTLNHYN